MPIIEGYARNSLARIATETQDVVTILQLFAAALREYGRPDAVVSDKGSVFTAGVYNGLLEVPEIANKQIARSNRCENLIESQFKVELRTADAQFEQATTLEAVEERHTAVIETFNETPQWAHEQPGDGLRTPVAMLGSIRGRTLELDRLEQVTNLRRCVGV